MDPGSVGPLRKRRLFVGRPDKVHEVKAESVGYVNHLYDIGSSGLLRPRGVEDPGSVDGMINGYEPELPATLALLDDAAPIPLQPWLRVLVPFVASLFVRGREYGPRFEARPVVRASGVSSPDNTNRARWLEMQLLLAPVTAARWVVFHQSGRESFIVNDLGLMPTRDLGMGQDGFAIPIGHQSALGIFPQHRRTVARYDDGWLSSIEHRFLGTAEVADFNRAITRYATEWIAGAERAVLEREVPHLGADQVEPAVILERWPFDHRTRVAHDRDWHRLVSATTGDPSPDDLPVLQVFDPSCMAGKWCPPIAVRLNMAELPTGLRLVGRNIRLTLQAPADYEDYLIPEVLL